MSDKIQRQIPLDYGTHGLTEEEQDLYKYCFEEDGYAYQFEEDKEKEQVEGEGYNHGYSEDDEDEEEEEENEFSPFHDLYSDDDRLDDEYDYDDDYGYEDKLFGNSGKSHHFSGKTPSSSEKMKKAGKSNKSSGGSSGLNTSIPLRRQLSSKSEDNLANHSQKYKVLEMLEASKQTNYWSVFDSSYQGVLEYGVVIKLIGWNQYLIYCAGQNVIGITLKGFLNHYRKIEEGDVVVYQVIDSSLTFTVSKVYISANSELEEIEILYRRGELSPPLYQLHKKIKEESMKVLSSQKGNSLQEFLYHCQERTVLPFRSSNHQNPAVLEEKKDQLSVSQITWEGSLTKELKELYHFNQMILEKIIDYFHDYLQKQPQMKYMILKMTNNTIRTSSSMNSLSNTSTVNSLLPTLTITTSDSVRGEDDTVVDDDVTKDRNNNNSKSSKKLEKSKSKVGILLYLFFLESIHHLLYQLPAVVNHRLPSHHTFNISRIRSGNPSQQRLNNLNNRTEKLRIQEIYHYSILSYNMNNCFGKLIRCLFQQILFYLCENNIFYSPLSAYPSPVKTKQCTLSFNTVPVAFEDLDDRPKGPIRSHSQEVYHRIIERICHMDVIINILPFLSFEDIYQCLFLLFPKSVTNHLYQHTIGDHHSNNSFDLSSSPNTNFSSLQILNHNNNASSNSASGSGSSSIFGNLENLKIIIQHFFHEINQNTYYIGIANDIYDLFSYNLDWEKFIQRVS